MASGATIAAHGSRAISGQPSAAVRAHQCVVRYCIPGMAARMRTGSQGTKKELAPKDELLILQHHVLTAPCAAVMDYASSSYENVS